MFPVPGLPVPFLHQSEGDRLWRGQCRIGGGRRVLVRRPRQIVVLYQRLLWSGDRIEENIGEEKLGHSFGINVFCAGAINYPLRKPMVHHDHD